MDNRAGFLKEILYEAGEISLRYFNGVRSERKQDGTFVTEADLEVNDFLIRRLNERFPDYGILSEEGGEELDPGTDRPTWVIDPIDGTGSFLAGFPVWGISVGLIEGAELSLGAVYIPVIKEMYSGGLKEKPSLNGYPIEISRNADFDRESVLFATTDTHRKYKIDFPGKCRTMGSIAAQVAFTAKGVSVGAIINSYLWDFAGAAAVLIRAGGCLAYLSGNPVDWQELLLRGRKLVPETIIASSSENIDSLRHLIEEIAGDRGHTRPRDFGKIWLEERQ